MEYGQKCRHLTLDEMAEKIKKGRKIYNSF